MAEEVHRRRETAGNSEAVALHPLNCAGDHFAIGAERGDFHG
jgi:hypothetical protein